MVFKKVCNKNNILLEKDKDKNIYKITFTLNNNNLDLKELMNESVYKLVAALNPNVIEFSEISNKTEDSFDYIYVYKPVLANLGDKSKRYNYETVTITYNNNNILYQSNNCNKPIPQWLTTNEYNRLDSKEDNLTVNFINKHSCQVTKTVHIDFEKEGLPIMAEDMIAMLIKKMFLSVKTFIEESR